MMVAEAVVVINAQIGFVTTVKLEFLDQKTRAINVTSPKAIQRYSIRNKA